MDPISVISLASSIGGLIDITSRSILALLSLQSRYSRFSLKIKHIAGQLSTLKAALRKIKDLVEISHDHISRSNGVSSLALDDEQLVCDLVLSIDCCESLVKVLDEQLGRFQLSSSSQSSGLSVVSTKMKFLWEESEIDEYQSMLNNQINALNLLLTVTQCESFLEQGKILRKKSSRLVFELVKDDTSSLLLQRDKESFVSGQSSAVDDVAFIDTEFGFEKDLFSSKAYRDVARSWMRQSILSKRKGDSSTTIYANREVSNHDANFQKRPRGLPAYTRVGRKAESPPRAKTPSTPSTPKTNFLLLGCSGSGKSTAMKVIYSATGRSSEYPNPTRMEYLERLVRTLEDHASNETVPSSSAKMDQLRELCRRFWNLCDRLHKDESPFESAESGTSLSALRELCKSIWDQVLLSGLWDKLPLGMFGKTHDHFYDSIDRLTEVDYTPHLEDTLWNYIKTTGIHEMILNNQKFTHNENSQDIKIIDVGGRRSERKKWIHTFTKVSDVFLFVDIAGYDEVLAEDESGNKMHESLLLFDSLVKSRWFDQTMIHLIFHQMDKLECKIAKGRYPDLGNECHQENIHTVNGVRDYYKRKFLELAAPSRRGVICVHYTSIYELESISNIFLDHAGLHWSSMTEIAAI